jgi:hypothetical protein
MVVRYVVPLLNRMLQIATLLNEQRNAFHYLECMGEWSLSVTWICQLHVNNSYRDQMTCCCHSSCVGIFLCDIRIDG